MGTPEGTSSGKYKGTHPSLTFSFDLSRASPRLWMSLGEAQSKCQHVAGIPLRPDTAERLHRIYLAKGVLATTAIEGNTLSHDEVVLHLRGELTIAPSREYLVQEIDNIIDACNELLRRIEADGPTDITVEFVKSLNALVLKNLEVGEDVIPGEIRRDERAVGRYRCAPAEDCNYLLHQLCNWLNGPDFKPSPGYEIVYGLIQAIVAHVYFVWIHPFGDGNGRTARLLEFKFLLEAGAPSDAAHLLSNYYNLTRAEYYNQLDGASRSGGDLLPFITYAVTGFVEQLREQIDLIRKQQLDVTWINYVHDRFKEHRSLTHQRRRKLVLALSDADEPVKKAAIRRLNPELAEEYADKTGKTITRDLNAVRKMGLIRRESKGYIANKEIISAFLPKKATGLSENRAGTTEMVPRQMKLL